MSVTGSAKTETARGRYPQTERDVATLDVTVLAGGPGAEREVSLQSGRAIHETLTRIGHRVTTADIGPDRLEALHLPADFIFIALHGEFGEDGTLQAHLDARGLPYSGSGTAASRLAMDKAEAKRVFERAGIATPGYALIEKSEHTDSTTRFDLPVVVKPNDAGSSVNTTIVRTREALHHAVEELIDQYGCALVERYIEGPELTVGILGDGALPVCEIRTPREFYDYQAKYVSNDTQYRFDIDLPADLLLNIQDQSLKAHRALGCQVFSRVDWMVERKTGEAFILEINTIPGFTNHSLLPKAAGRAGISFDGLCQRIIELSLKKGRGASNGTGSP